jgi:hypothetical protein
MTKPKPKTPNNHAMLVDDGDGNTVRLKFINITSVEKEGDGLRITSKHLSEAKVPIRYFKNGTITGFEEVTEYADIFCKVKNNAIVNMEQIVSYCVKDETFLMANGRTVKYSVAGLAHYKVLRPTVTF